MNALMSAQSGPGLVLLGMGVLASLSLFYSDRRHEGQDSLHLAMTVMGRVMILCGFAEACVLLLNLVFALMFGVALIFVIVFAVFRYWRRRQASLLAVMAAAARRWAPLAPAIEGFGREWRGWFGWRCGWLARALEAGVPLPDALRQVGWLVPRRALVILEAGARSGNLVAALEEVTRQPVGRPVFVKAAAAVWYFASLALLGGGVLAFVMVKIIPAFIKIFYDFDAELPLLTQVLIEASNWFVVGWPILFLLLLGILCYGALLLFGVVGWLPPPLGIVRRRLESAVVLRSLSAAAAARQSLLPALSALAEHYPSQAIRWRLIRAMNDLNLGDPWQDSLERHGLLRRADAVLLTSAERVGNLPWALREVADAIERRVANRALAWLEIIVPGMILVAGAVVMFVVVGLFLPLIRLIEGLT